MQNNGAPVEKAVPTAAAAAARRGMLPFLLAFLANCMAPERTPHSLTDQLTASVPGYRNVRFYADLPASDLPEQRDQYLPVGAGADGRSTWLALSSGGAGGAFGAGVLTGWTQRGDRPQFDLVTGVSAGALIAPFAFIGAAADKELAQLFTAASVAKLNKSRSLLAGVFGQSAIPAKPLRALIDTHVDTPQIDRIAARHRAGGRLLIVTTNLDAQRSVVWDIGKIAASERPDRLQLIGDILEASASIPAIFPPVRIDVETNGKSFEELHADGGAIRQIYLLPDAFYLAGDIGNIRPDIYAIINTELTPNFAVVPQQSIRVAERALSSLEKASTLRSTAEMATFARSNKASFRMTYIDRSLNADKHIPFDPDYMQAAFALGQTKGRSAGWAFTVPVGTGLLEEDQ
ncbi:MAG: hypothetical protein ACJAVM_003525 [Sulfitobacter sp.]|jgi:hypothetical protein